MAKKAVKKAGTGQRGRPPKPEGIESSNISVYVADARVKEILEKVAEKSNKRLGTWLLERAIHGGPNIGGRNIENIREIYRQAGGGPVI